MYKNILLHACNVKIYACNVYDTPSPTYDWGEGGCRSLRGGRGFVFYYQCAPSPFWTSPAMLPI